MKKIITFILIIILGIIAYHYINTSPEVNTPIETEINQNEIINTSHDEEITSLEGCYIAVNGQDVYTLTIDSQEGNNIKGSLEFDNYQKDSSRGSFVGNYENGILLGDYSFSSEGMDSVMQVIFQKQENDFVRGYGDVTAEGTEFVNPQEINYEVNNLSLFEKTECTQL